MLALCPAVEKGVPVKDNNTGQWRVGVGKTVKFHCIFLAWNRERAWLSEKEYKKFKREDGGEGRKKEYIVKSKEFRARHLEAIELALKILKDPSNLMLYLEKTHINESNTALPVEDVDATNNIIENESVEKKSRKKVKKNVDQSNNKTENNNNVMVEVEGSSAKPSAGFFQAIDEKVKIPRSRKKVDKFPSDSNDVGKIGKIRKFLQNSNRGTSSAEVCLCMGCRQPDCGQCRFCMDMTCFGGRGTLKMRCTLKNCVSGTNEVSDEMVDGKVAVGDDVDIVGILNKGKRANIIDAESETDSDDAENPLVINFDLDDNSKAVKELCSTLEEMPSSSSISYKSCNSRNSVSDGALNVWDQVNSTMMDVEETLANSSVKLGSSLNQFPPQASPRSPLLSPAGSSNSALTISTPEQSPRGSSVSTRNLDSDDGIFIHADDIDVIIKENIVDKSVNVNENGREQEFGVKKKLDEDNIVDKSVAVNENGREQEFDAKKKLDKVKDRNTILDEVKLASSASKKPTQVGREVEVRKHEVEVDHVKLGVEESTDKMESKTRYNYGEGIETTVGDNAKKLSNSDSNHEVEKLVYPENIGKASSKGSGCKVSTEKFKVTEFNMFGSLDKVTSKRQVRYSEKKSLKPNEDKVAQATDTILRKGGIHDTMSWKGQPDSEKSEGSLAKSQHKTTKSKSNMKDKIKSRCNKFVEKVAKRNVKPDQEEKLKSKDCHSQKKFMSYKSDTKYTKKGCNDNNDSADTKVKPNLIVEEKKKNKKQGKYRQENGSHADAVSLPFASASSLAPFKIPKSYSNEVDGKTAEKQESSKRNRKELKNDIRKRVENVKNAEKQDDVKKNTSNSVVGGQVDGNSATRDQNQKFSNFTKKDTSTSRSNPTMEQDASEGIQSVPEIANKVNSRDWVAAVDWSEQIAPDSTTNDDEAEKKCRIVDIEDDTSDCSLGSKEDSSWKRKRKVECREVVDKKPKKVKFWTEEQKTIRESERLCCFRDEISARNFPMPKYIMSREILDTLGENVLFDSHCHMDFIIFWKSPELELESFDQFVHAYPVLDHPSLEGFITNFCSPKIWLEHLVSPSPLVHSMLSRPSIFYTIGCHPHYATDLLSSRKFAQLELLVQNAGAKCVAIGECGLDTSSKNTVRMSEQVLCFQKQVRLAMKYEKPLVLHIRGAEKEAIAALEEVGLPRDWPIHRHCWNDTLKVCEAWLKKYPQSVVGLTPLITFSRVQDLLNVAEKIPLDRLVLETDAPYFLPRGGGPDSHLGHYNKSFSLPIHVANVAAQVATVRKVAIEEVLAASRRNVLRVYGV